MGGVGITPGNGSSQPGSYHPSGNFGHSYSPALDSAQHNYFGNSFGRSNSFGANQQRSFMSGNGFRDQAASSRGWGSMRSSAMSGPMRLGAPRSFGGFRR